MIQIRWDDPFDWGKYPQLHGKMLEFFDDPIDAFYWTQDAHARDEYDKEIDWDDRNAAKFSLLGCVYKLYRGTKYWGVITRYMHEIFPMDLMELALIDWNDVDGRKKEEVLEFLKKHQL